MIKIKLMVQGAISKILGMTVVGKVACALAAVTVVGGIAGGTVYLVNNNGDVNNTVAVENSDESEIDDDIIAKDEDNSRDKVDLGNEEEQADNENQGDSEKNETSDATSDITSSDDNHNTPAGDNIKQVQQGGNGGQVQQQQPQQPQQQQQQQPPQQPQHKVNVGIDDSISQQLRNIFLANTRSYNGCKRDEFSNLTRQVALGQVSAEGAKQKIASMRWNENANSVDKYYPSENRSVVASNVKMDKVTVPNMSAEQISNTVHVNVSEYSEVYAYRNADNSITITTFACSFVLSTIN